MMRIQSLRQKLVSGCLALLSVYVAACGSHKQSLPSIPTLEQSTVPPVESTYLLHAGDQLAIKFYHNPELNEEKLAIRPDGMISLQLIGDVPAAGLTPAALGQ